VSESLSSLEKFGVLARKFLHDTSNDFTALGLNLHFIEKSIEPDHPAYKDFKNLSVALKNLQQNTRILMNWRRQLPDPLKPIPAGEILALLPLITGWVARSEIDPAPARVIKVYPSWLASLVQFLAQSQQGTILCKIIKSPNDQCATADQLNLLLEPADASLTPPLPEIEWALHRELAKLMGGGIVLDLPPQKPRTILFLPVYAS
jgi:hypothetical protein